MKLLFEFPSTLGNDAIAYFYGLFWGEQQPFASSGCGGLYFFKEMHRRSYFGPLVFLLVFVSLAFIGKLIVDQIVSWPARMMSSASDQVAVDARKIRNAFVDLFQLQPKISVNETAVFDQTKTALELVVVSRDTDVTHDAAETWLGSTKTIRIHASYRVKAGFNLAKELEVTVEGQEVNIKVPKATILSVEQLSVGVDELKNGFWNKIQPEDIDRELQKMPELARAKAATLPSEAEETFGRLLSEKLSDFHVHVQTKPDAASEN
ncbi:MAG: hypothetical protein QOE88_2772 [Verrucomicrobiota bacterium]|nr:hypothetical protein [Verrucomicrobiota bacterium]MEA3164954.1 hypothetical protein [Verrucomicrobiota bacterium]